MSYMYILVSDKEYDSYLNIVQVLAQLYPDAPCRLELEPLIHNQVGIKCLFYSAMTMRKALSITAKIANKAEPLIEQHVEDNVCYYRPCRYSGSMYEHPLLPSVSFNKRNKKFCFGHSQGFNPRPTVILGEAAPFPLDNPLSFQVEYKGENHTVYLITERDWRMFMDNLPIFPIQENHYRESPDVDDIESYDVSPVSKMYNYLLIDYENIQPDNLDVLQLESFKIINFIGKKQTRVFMDFARAMQGMGCRAEYIQTPDTGKNAVDFHISCYLGKLSTKYPNAKLFVLSKDKGYDPLIEHLQKTGINVRRVITLDDCEPLVKTIKKDSEQADQVKEVIERIKTSRENSLPKKKESLRNMIIHVHKKQLSKVQANRLLKIIEHEGYVTIDSNDNVHYHPDGREE